jgi:hypothetical protein
MMAEVYSKAGYPPLAGEKKAGKLAKDLKAV